MVFGDRAGCKRQGVKQRFGCEDEKVIAQGRRCFSVNDFTTYAPRYSALKKYQALAL